MSTLGGYHDKCGGRSLERQLNLYRNPGVHLQGRDLKRIEKNSI